MELEMADITLRPGAPKTPDIFHTAIHAHRGLQSHPWMLPLRSIVGHLTDNVQYPVRQTNQAPNNPLREIRHPSTMTSK